MDRRNFLKSMCALAAADLKQKLNAVKNSQDS